MSTLPKELLHIYVTIVIAFFIIVCLLAASGKFDHWTAGRFISRVRRIRFRRRRDTPNDEPPN